jgi:DNA replicative helicase MCM subunit Mcm2 (Cdc46/Mcm family)
MARRKVIKTQYSDMRDLQGRLREVVHCTLDCGHAVDVFYHSRRAYTHANCPWCNREKAEGVKYVWRYDPDGSTYVPES